MAAHFGKIGEFDEKQEEWTQYVERLDHFYAANEIDNADKKRAILLTVIGPTAYKLLRNLVAPAKPGEKTYDALVTAMKQQHNSTPSEIVQRYMFNSRFRQPGETVSTYMSELRSLAEHCNYGPTLDQMLRDRLVCGIKDEHIQRPLLSEDKLTLQKAMGIALGLEAASKNAKTLQGASAGTFPEVNKLTSSKQGPPRQSAPACHCCGKSNHSPANCRFKSAKCNHCGKVGHIKAACRALRKPADRTVCSKHRDIRLVRETSAEHATEYTLFSLNSEDRHKPYTVSVEVEGQELTMEIDTGASLSLISETTRKRLWPNKRLLPTI